MPLHDWKTDAGWECLHAYWIVEIAKSLRPRLPEGYRVHIGPLPGASRGAAEEESDSCELRGTAQDTPREKGSAPAERDPPEPDIQIARYTPEPERTVYVERGGWLVSAVEIVSPRNKDRPAARDRYAARYAGYLIGGIHLLLIDLLPKPRGFSFADRIAQELEIPDKTPLPAPMAAAYRVGEPAAEGGSYLAIWRRTLVVGQPLPTLPLPLTVHRAVPVDLESTYMQAAADAYLT